MKSATRFSISVFLGINLLGLPLFSNAASTLRNELEIDNRTKFTVVVDYQGHKFSIRPNEYHIEDMKVGTFAYAYINNEYACGWDIPEPPYRYSIRNLNIEKYNYGGIKWACSIEYDRY